MVRLFLAAGFLFCLLVQSAYCDEALNSSIRAKEDKTTDAIVKNLSVRTSGDLRPVLAKMRTQNKLVKGKNLILETKAQGNMPAIRLYATINKGKITKWQGVDANGSNLPTTTQRLDSPEGEAKCMLCVDVQIPGMPPEQTEEMCFEIECKDRPPLGLGVTTQ